MVEDLKTLLTAELFRLLVDRKVIFEAQKFPTLDDFVTGYRSRRIFPKHRGVKWQSGLPHQS